MKLILTVLAIVGILGASGFSNGWEASSSWGCEWYFENLEVNTWIDADSVDVEQLVVNDSLVTQDSTVTMLPGGLYLADDDSLRVYSDKFNLYLEQDQSLGAGDRDMSIIFREEDGGEHAIYWNDSNARFETDAQIKVNGNAYGSAFFSSGDFGQPSGYWRITRSGSGLLTLYTDGSNMDSIRIDADNSPGPGIILMGGNDKDSIVVRSSDSLVVEGKSWFTGDMNVSGDADFTGDVTLGPLNTADDGGEVAVFNRDVTSGAVDGTKQGITIQTDTTNCFSAGAMADGSGGVDEIYATAAGMMSYTPSTHTFTTEGDLPDPLNTSVLLLSGDDDSDNDVLDLQDGSLEGQIVVIVAAANVDANDTVTIDTSTDTTGLNIPAIVFDDLGENVVLMWTGSAWVILSEEDNL
jgi:hypothetical protein